MSIHYVAIEEGKEEVKHILLQNFLKRGFGYKAKKPEAPATPTKRKRTESRSPSPAKTFRLDESASETEEEYTSQPVTPCKRKSMDSTCLESPLKRMNLDTPQRQQEVPQEEVTPSKRRSMDTTHLASPLKRMNLDEADLDLEANIFKVPQNTPTPSRRGIKSLTMDELIEYTIQCTQNVVITRVESDVENSQHNSNGPWAYKSSSKTWIYYNIVQTPDTLSQKIRLDSLRSQ